MAFVKIKLTDEHLKLIENIKFEKFVFDMDTRNGRYGWGIDQYSLFGGSYALEDIALILGHWDEYIRGTENDPMGRHYPEELENHMWELYHYIWDNMEHIIRLVFYFNDKGGLTPGEYKFDTNNETWEKID
jgi:hypothetical protein